MSLIELQIENFAIIEKLKINFKPGLTILTGETGAGKSIIIDALNLALGEKANPNLIRAGSESAVVECKFSLVNNLNLQQLLKQNNIDLEKGEIVLKREVSQSGRSKAWINGSACSIGLLKEVGNFLVDLHGQHDHQSLLNEETHIQFLDAFGNYLDLLRETELVYTAILTLREKRNLLEEKLKILQEKRELWSYQLQEINKVNPKQGEYEELLAEKQILENTEKIHSLIHEINFELYEGEQSIYQKLFHLNKLFAQLGRLSNRFQEEVNQLAAHQYFYQELAHQLSSFGNEVQFNPVRLEAVNQRLYAIQQLIKKYGPSVEAVLEKQKQLEQELSQEDTINLDLENIDKQLKIKINEYLTLADQLNVRRRQTAEIFEHELEKILHRLGIRGAKFKVTIERIQDEDSWAKIEGVGYKAFPRGLDIVKFFISTNPGEPLRPLSQIVSGGEVSRIMLAIKSLLAGRDQIPVLIFDEIDTGISGQIARIVGEELRNLAKFHQVICITHLPQIAGLANDHLYVNKVTEGGRSKTEVRRLSPEERILAVAELIGGRTITEATKQQARELIE